MLHLVFQVTSHVLWRSVNSEENNIKHRLMSAFIPGFCGVFLSANMHPYINQIKQIL